MELSSPFLLSALLPGPAQMNRSLLRSFLDSRRLNGADQRRRRKNHTRCHGGGIQCQVDQLENRAMLAAILGDTVWNDVDGDGLQGGSEPGLAGVFVELVNSSNSVIADTVTADGSGSNPLGYYEFGVQDPGDYTLRFYPLPGFAFTQANASFNAMDALDSDAIPIGPVPAHAEAAVTIVTNTDDLTVDAGMRATTRVTGQKWNDLDADGVRDPDEPGIEGVTILVRDSSGNVIERQTTYSTDFDGGGFNPITEVGLFEFHIPGTGQFTIEEVVPHGWTATTPTTISLNIDNAGDDIPPVGFGNTLPGSIHGFKFHDVDGDGHYDPDRVFVSSSTPPTQSLSSSSEITMCDSQHPGLLVLDDGNGTFIHATVRMENVRNATSGAGGGRSGTQETFDADVVLDFVGLGPLFPNDYQRTLTVPGVSVVVDHDPHADQVAQILFGDVISLDGLFDGAAVSDPDFLTLSLRAGSAFSLPSPGQSELLRQSGSPTQYEIDSFFDITFEIEFTGAPGGPLDGLNQTQQTQLQMEPKGNSRLDEPQAGVVFTLTDELGNTVVDVSGNPVQPQTSADSQVLSTWGEFWFENLKPGTYHLTESVPLGWAATTPTTQVITVVAGEEYAWRPGAAMLQDLRMSESTDFEGIEESTFVVGGGNLQATFSGGGSNTLNDPELIFPQDSNQPTQGFSWGTQSGETGTITFESPVDEVELYIRQHSSANGPVQVSIFDRAGVAIVDSFFLTIGDGSEASHADSFFNVAPNTRVGEPMDGSDRYLIESRLIPIGRIEVQNLSTVNDGNDVAAIDNLTFTQVARNAKTEILVGPQLMFGNTIPGSIHGHKFLDANGDGERGGTKPAFDWSDPGSPGIALTQDPQGTAFTATEDGTLSHVDLPVNVTGTAGDLIVEFRLASTLQIGSVLASRTISVASLASGQSVETVDFSSDQIPLRKGSGYAVTVRAASGSAEIQAFENGGIAHPAPANWLGSVVGSCDTFNGGADCSGLDFEAFTGTPQDAGLSGVVFEITGTDNHGNAVGPIQLDPTNSDGEFWREGLMPGVYTVTEQVQAGWASTTHPTGASPSATFVINSGQELAWQEGAAKLVNAGSDIVTRFDFTATEFSVGSGRNTAAFSTTNGIPGQGALGGEWRLIGETAVGADGIIQFAAPVMQVDFDFVSRPGPCLATFLGFVRAFDASGTMIFNQTLTPRQSGSLTIPALSASSKISRLEFESPYGGCGSGILAIDNFSYPAVEGDIRTEVVVGEDLVFGNTQPGAIHGTKFNDLNGNGIRDAGEPGLAGWTVGLFDPGTGLPAMNPITNQPYSVVTMADDPNTPLTDETGMYVIRDVMPGTYNVAETQQTGWIQTAPAAGVHTVTISSGGLVTGADFGNYQRSSVSGRKFHDRNANGQHDTGEEFLNGWEFRLVGTDASGNIVNVGPVTSSDKDLNNDNVIDPLTETGWFTFEDVPAGTSYRILETPRDGWVQSFAGIANSPQLPGDANHDGSINIFDFTEFSRLFNGTAPLQGCDVHSDWNGDGKVDIADFSLFSAQYGKSDGLGHYLSAPGGGPVLIPGCGSASTSITVEPGSMIDTITVGNYATGSIHLLKFNDANSNGEWDLDGSENLVSNIPFLIREVDANGDPVPGGYAQTIVTGTNPARPGAIDVTGLKPARYHIAEIVPGGQLSTTHPMRTITSGGVAGLIAETFISVESGKEYVYTDGAAQIPAGWPQTEVNIGTQLIFGNGVAGEIYGFAFHDRDNDNNFYPSNPYHNEETLSGFTFDLIDVATGTVVDTQTTGSATRDVTGDGVPDPIFRFTGLQAGDYQVIQRDHSVSGWFRSTAEDGYSDIITVNGSTTSVRFGNFRPGAIHGVKFEDLDGNGTFDPQHGEAGMAGVDLKLLRLNQAFQTPGVSVPDTGSTVTTDARIGVSPVTTAANGLKPQLPGAMPLPGVIGQPGFGIQIEVVTDDLLDLKIEIEKFDAAGNVTLSSVLFDGNNRVAGPLTNPTASGGQRIIPPPDVAPTHINVAQGQDYYVLVFNDATLLQPDPFRPHLVPSPWEIPETPLSVFYGSDPNGDYRLKVTDLNAGNSNSSEVTRWWPVMNLDITTTVTTADNPATAGIDETGFYSFTELPPLVGYRGPGNHHEGYLLRETPPAGTARTTVEPNTSVSSGELKVALGMPNNLTTGSGQYIVGSERLWIGNGHLDYGDAPEIEGRFDFPTSIGNDGAVHRIKADLHLGERIDGEPDGQPDLDALGDDVNFGSSVGGTGDDEDGVQFTSAIVRGVTTTVDVTASRDGYLTAWMDWNLDGVWDPSEKIFNVEPLSAGLNSLTVQVPGTALASTTTLPTFSRWRFTEEEVALTPNGRGTSDPSVALPYFGEVEDHIHQVTDGPTIIPPGGPIRIPRPTIRWSPIHKCGEYEVLIADPSLANDPIVARVTGTEFIPAEDLPLAAWDVQVRGILDDDSYTEWSDIEVFQIQPRPVILQPSTNLTLQPTIDWEPVAGAARYDVVFDYLTGGQNSFLRNTNVPINSFTPENGLPLGDYTVWVKPYSADNYGGTWSSTRIRLDAPPVLLSPHGGSFDSTPTFNWTAGSPSQTYEIWVRQSFPVAISRVVGASGITGTSFTLTTPLEAGDFRWWVRATESNGFRSRWSEGSSFNTLGRTVVTGPETPLSLAPTISWQPVEQATRYEVWVNDDSGSRVAHTTTATGTSFRVPQPLAQGTQHTAWVKAYVVGNGGFWSPSFRFETPLAPPVITAPTGTTTANPPTLTWTSPAGAVRFELWVNNQTTGQVRVIHETNLSAAEFTPATALASGAYRMWVRSINAEGSRSQWSEFVDFTVAASTTPQEGIDSDLLIGNVEYRLVVRPNMRVRDDRQSTNVVQDDASRTYFRDEESTEKEAQQVEAEPLDLQTDPAAAAMIDAVLGDWHAEDWWAERGA